MTPHVMFAGLYLVKHFASMPLFRAHSVFICGLEFFPDTMRTFL